MFCLDKGPDNVLAARLVKEQVSSSAHIMVLVLPCLLHQFHIMYSNVLGAVEAFEFTDMSFPVAYWSGIATVANVWRGTGARRPFTLFSLVSIVL